MKNKYEVDGNVCKIEVVSGRWGVNYVIIDIADMCLFENRTIFVQKSPRHNSAWGMVQVEGGKSKRLHRLLMQPQPHEVVDHINGNSLDNRRENLRVTTQAGNNKNAGKRKDAMTSKYKGVRQPKGSKKWVVQLQANYKTILGGTFDTEIQAALHYNKLALLHFGEFAKLNIIEETTT